MPSQQQNNVHRASPFYKHFNLFPFIAFVLLTYNAVMSVYRSTGNPWEIAFVISCYSELTFLFFCMMMRVNLGAAAPEEHVHWLKIIVFILSPKGCLLITLTSTFAFRVSLSVPFLVKLVVWGMSGLIMAAGLYAFFIFERDVKGLNGYFNLDDRSPEERV
jgi:hypothetical protein